MCILLITFYTFFITFISKKIKFRSFSVSSSLKEGNSFSVVLENKTLSPILIDNINLIVNNQYKIPFKKFDSPLIIEPFTAKKIHSEKYSYMSPDLEIIDDSKNTLEVIMTGGKKIYLNSHKKTPRIKRKMKNSSSNVQIVTNIYNGKIVPKYARYALTIFKDGEKDTTFIFKTGVMTEEIYGYNGIPKKNVKTKASLIAYLEDFFKSESINIDSYYVKELYIQDEIEDNII